MPKQEKMIVSFYKRPQLFHTPEHNDGCIALFGEMSFSLMVFSMCSVMWQKVTSTVPEMYQVCKIAKNCGYMMAFGKRNWKTPVNIGGYSGEVSFEALGGALTIYCIQTLREESAVKSETLLQGLHAYAAKSPEYEQIKKVVAACSEK